MLISIANIKEIYFEDRYLITVKQIYKTYIRTLRLLLSAYAIKHVKTQPE